MSNGHHAYMRPEKGGKIERIPLHTWAKYRRSGYVFVENGAAEFAKQQNARSPEEVEAENTAAASKKKKKKKKVMRRTDS